MLTIIEQPYRVRLSIWLDQFASFPRSNTIFGFQPLRLQSTMKFAAVLSALLAATASGFVANQPSKATSALNLAVGETAPDFELKDQNGKVVKRSSIKKPLVVYFYPADSTPGCTVQAQSFNQQVNEIRKNFGAELVGISGQGAESKQKFAEELGLTFSILADEGDKVRKAFAVPRAGK